MRPIAVYSALRLGIFLGCLAVLFVLGARGVLAVLLAAVVSLGLSYVVLSRQRDSITRALIARRGERAGRGRRMGRLLDDDAAAEDSAVDEARAGDQSRRDAGPDGQVPR